MQRYTFFVTWQQKYSYLHLNLNMSKNLRRSKVPAWPTTFIIGSIVNVLQKIHTFSHPTKRKFSTAKQPSHT